LDPGDAPRVTNISTKVVKSEINVKRKMRKFGMKTNFKIKSEKRFKVEEILFFHVMKLNEFVIRRVINSTNT